MVFWSRNRLKSLCRCERNVAISSFYDISNALNPSFLYFLPQLMQYEVLPFQVNLAFDKGKIKLISTRKDIKPKIEPHIVFSEKEVKRLALTGLS